MKKTLLIFLLLLISIMSELTAYQQSTTIYMDRRDSQRIYYNMLLKYNQQIDQLSYTTKGPVKVHVASELLFDEYTDITDESDPFPIDEIVFHTTKNNYNAYLIK